MSFPKIGILLAGLLLLASNDVAKSASLANSDIASVVNTAAGITNKNAQMALQKTKSPEVKAFATQMLSDHQGIQQKLTTVMVRESAKSTENRTSTTLLNEALGDHDKLVVLKGAAFDRAYLENEAKFHQKVVTIYQNELIPSVQNPILKDLLVATLPGCKPWTAGAGIAHHTENKERQPLILKAFLRLLKAGC